MLAFVGPHGRYPSLTWSHRHCGSVKPIRKTSGGCQCPMGSLHASANKRQKGRIDQALGIRDPFVPLTVHVRWESHSTNQWYTFRVVMIKIKRFSDSAQFLQSDLPLKLNLLFVEPTPALRAAILKSGHPPDMSCTEIAVGFNRSFPQPLPEIDKHNITERTIILVTFS